MISSLKCLNFDFPGYNHSWTFDLDFSLKNSWFSWVIVAVEISYFLSKFTRRSENPLCALFLFYKIYIRFWRSHISRALIGQSLCVSGNESSSRWVINLHARFWHIFHWKMFQKHCAFFFPSSFVLTFGMIFMKVSIFWFGHHRIRFSSSKWPLSGEIRTMDVSFISVWNMSINDLRYPWHVLNQRVF